MLVPDRRRRVLDHVRRHGSAQVEVLADAFGVSAWTVRRDLDELERQGLLQRTHGGAFVESAPGPGDAAPADDAELREVKDRIATAAAQRIPDGSTIMLLAGSTTGALVGKLAGRRLTVVTNGLEIANGLKHAADVSLVLLGGVLHREQMTLLGPLTETTMADLHVDLIVAGAYGVHADTGVTGAKIIQAGYRHSMLQHTDGLLVLADASKLGRRGPTLLAEMGLVDTLVTDISANTDVVAAIRQRGCEVVLA